MKWSRLNPRHFWTVESGMTGLLIFTVAYLFFVCALGHLRLGDLVANLCFSLVILAGVLTTFKQRWVHTLIIILAVGGLALSWVKFIHPEPGLILLSAFISLFFLGFLLAVLIVQVFQGGRVTAHRIRGAIVVYLLLGGLWGLVYQIIALTIPQSFYLPDGLTADDATALPRLLTYFSFTTLTTTGFGDIIPTQPLTRTLAIFEALTGQLYLVITLARLVSLAIVAPKDVGEHE